MILGDLVVGTESMNDSVYQNVLSYTAGFLVKYADEAKDMVQREYKQESIKNTTETIRLYALQDKANEAFVTDKDCLIKFMKLYGKVSNVKVKGGVLKRDMDAFYAQFMAALKEAIIILNSPDKRYEPVGEFDDNIDTQLNKLHNMYNNAFNNPRTKKTPPENQKQN